MRVAVIGSRNLQIHGLAAYLPPQTTELISGGAVGVDTCVKQYAADAGLKLTEILPDYRRYGKSAPLKRNDRIIESADLVIAFWDGMSRGTEYVIRECRKRGVAVEVHLIQTK